MTKLTFHIQKSQVTIQFIRKLLEAGAEIDTLDRRDRTPIMIAAEFHPDPGYEFEIMYDYYWNFGLEKFGIFSRPDSQNHLILSFKSAVKHNSFS